MALRKYDLTNIGASFAEINRIYQESGNPNPFITIDINYIHDTSNGSEIISTKHLGMHLVGSFWEAMYNPLNTDAYIPPRDKSRLMYYPSSAVGFEVSIGQDYNYNTGNMEVVRYTLSDNDVDKWMSFSYYFNGGGFQINPPYSPDLIPSIPFDDLWISNIYSSSVLEFSSLHDGSLSIDGSTIEYDRINSMIQIGFAHNVDIATSVLQALFNVLESSDLDSDNGSCDEPTTPPSASTPTSEVMNLLNNIAKVVQNAEGSTSKKIRGSELPSRIQNLLENSESGGSGGGIIPSGSITFSSNGGPFDITNYSEAFVNVASSNDDNAAKILNRTISGSFTDTSLENIGYYAFAGCSFLSEINLPNCSSIGSYAFEGCLRLSSVNLPNCTYIYSNAFPRMSLTEVGPSGSTTIVGINYISIPKCQFIGGGALKGCTGVSSWNLPECLYLVQSSTYNNNYGAPGAPEYYDAVFPENTTTVSAPKCKIVGTSAFTYCYNLGNVSLPECMYVAESAFYNCTSLQSITLPKCSEIASYAFTYCYNLGNVSLPVCSYIGYSGFAYCSALQSVYLPICSSLYMDAFAYCSSLETISLPNLIYVDYHTFAGCSNLKSVSLPALTETGYGMFSGCYSLKSVDLPECTRTQFSTFSGCAIERVSLPKCSYLENGTFSGCSTLQSISLPCCSYIGNTAFMKCSSLSTAYLGAATSVLRSAFMSCSALASLYINTSSVPYLSMSVFHYTPMSSSGYLGYFGSIYVRESLVNSFKTATNWTAYSDRITGYNFEE